MLATSVDEACDDNAQKCNSAIYCASIFIIILIFEAGRQPEFQQQLKESESV